MQNALIFSAVVAVVAAPFPICIGLFGRDVRRRRLDIDRGVDLDAAEFGREDMQQMQSGEVGESPARSRFSTLKFWSR
ncbi:uncharacterized protein LDX57_005897 [Aspergillus melleus]|uniref:uncharacterized protein n=1 Tax=Aspergillus melleus TaxID=138277 RepID=UPI001E8E1F6F|nr:uncharacterized protein LDX57_005897 [Aspergillus melleus]KAH8428192.1 hypothetical protein LDX57_005897 [Aspergillus melleus]